MSKHTDWRANVMMGSDPELFVVNKNGEARPARQYVELMRDYRNLNTGNALNKTSAVKVHKLIYDNIAVEFQPLAAPCTQHHIDYIRGLLLDFFYMLRDPNARKSYNLSSLPALPLPNVQLGEEVMEFGCSPSMIFTEAGSQISVPHVRPENCEYRCIGGHIHIGIPPNRNHALVKEATSPAWKANMQRGPNIREEVDSLRLTGLCDIFLGTVGVLMENRMGRKEEAKLRRAVIGYGQAGEYRTPKHGYEYRTLSPWWMEHPVFMHMVLNLARDCYHAWVSGDIADPLLNAIERARVVEAINNCDAEECESILMEGLRFMYDWSAEASKLDRYGDGGYDSILYNPTDHDTAANLVGALASLKPDSHEHWVMSEAVENPDGVWLQYHDFRDKNAHKDYLESVNSWIIAQRRWQRSEKTKPKPKKPKPEPAFGSTPVVAKEKYDLHHRWFFESHRWGWKNWSHELTSKLNVTRGTIREEIQNDQSPILQRW